MAEERFESTEGMTEEQWLFARHPRIGASDVAPILNLSQYRTPYQVWVEKTAKEPIVHGPDNIFTRAGKKQEAVVAEYFEEEEHLKLQRDFKFRIHPVHDFLIASLDRVVTDPSKSGPGLAELKFVSTDAYRHWKEEIPLPYYCQVQHQFACTGFSWGYIAYLIGGFEYLSFPLVPDLPYIEEQTGLLVNFWNNHVLTGIPPEPKASDLQIMPHVPASMIEATEAVSVLHAKALRAAADEKEAKITKEETRDKIKEFMGTNEILRFRNENLATYRMSADGRKFDMERFKEAYSDLHEMFVFRQPGSRRLLLKGGKD